MPAFARASSCSCDEPELAMPPIVSPPIVIGTAPPSGSPRRTFSQSFYAFAFHRGFRPGAVSTPVSADRTLAGEDTSSRAGYVDATPV